MLRIQTTDGWTLIEHREHARLAGEFARHWGNDQFSPPQPILDILVAVSRHDDAWAERDALPLLTREGRPSAFSEDLVGTYSAFEEIDLLDYLAVRGRATEAVAADNPYAAIIVSMHTVNLLTEQADLSHVSLKERAAHAKFIEAQLERQCELAALHSRAEEVSPAALNRGFKFLQACDSLSLLACVAYPAATFLRHEQPLKNGTSRQLRCTPAGRGVFQIEPYPFDHDTLTFQVPARTVEGRTWANVDAFRNAYDSAEVRLTEVKLQR